MKGQDCHERPAYHVDAFGVDSVQLPRVVEIDDLRINAKDGELLMV